MTIPQNDYTSYTISAQTNLVRYNNKKDLVLFSHTSWVKLDPVLGNKSVTDYQYMYTFRWKCPEWT